VLPRLRRALLVAAAALVAAACGAHSHVKAQHPLRPGAVAAPAGHHTARPVLGAFASGRGGMLPPGALRGPAHRLRQYPAVWLATAAQRAAATHLLNELETVTSGWRDARVAAVAGFDTRPARRAGEQSVGYLHAEHHGFAHDGRYLDPRRPETLIYANVPGRPLVLVGVMFSVPRGVHGPTPGGPLTRWHSHRVCVRGEQRGLTPRPDGTCPSGTSAHQGSEMLHIWFTHDLRSAYAIHAPEPELCAGRLLPAPLCGHRPHHVM
jgi:hypothetical protein